MHVLSAPRRPVRGHCRSASRAHCHHLLFLPGEGQAMDRKDDGLLLVRQTHLTHRTAMCNNTDLKGWSTISAMLSAIIVLESRADESLAFNQAIRAGETNKLSACITTPSESHNYTIQFPRALPSFLNWRTLRVYSTSQAVAVGSSVKVYRACAEAELVATQQALPGEYLFVVRYNYTGKLAGGALTVGTGTVDFNVKVMVEGDAPCDVQLEGVQGRFESKGGTASVQVLAQAGCSWRVESDASWITLKSPAQGHSSGSVTYTVAPNPGGMRNGALSIGSNRYVITQDGDQATLSIAFYSGVTVRGTEGVTYQVEVSDSLGGPLWDRLATVVAGRIPIVIFDTNSVGPNRSRFYRAIPVH